MKGKLFLLVICLFSGIVEVEAQEKSPLQLIREDLFYSDFDLDKCFEFYKSITSLNDASPVVSAYQAAAAALIAKYTWNPISKINYLNSSQKILDSAVMQDGLNIEIRFLRLYIQRSIPGYLGMSKNKEEDKRIIIEHIEKLNSMNLGTDIMDYIINYITSPKVSNEHEIATIKSKIDNRTKPPSF